MAIAVLIADDSRMSRTISRKLLQAVLAGREASIEERADGRQALAATAEKPFDIVLLDLTMPEMTGYEVLQHLRDRNFGGKVIVISADIQKGAVERVLSLGAHCFLKKPIAEADLAKALTSAGVL